MSSYLPIRKHRRCSLGSCSLCGMLVDFLYAKALTSPSLSAPLMDMPPNSKWIPGQYRLFLRRSWTFKCIKLRSLGFEREANAFSVLRIRSALSGRGRIPFKLCCDRHDLLAQVSDAFGGSRMVRRDTPQHYCNGVQSLREFHEFRLGFVDWRHVSVQSLITVLERNNNDLLEGSNPQKPHWLSPLSSLSATAPPV